MNAFKIKWQVVLVEQTKCLNKLSTSDKCHSTKVVRKCPVNMHKCKRGPGLKLFYIYIQIIRFNYLLEGFGNFEIFDW